MLLRVQDGMLESKLGDSTSGESNWPLPQPDCALSQEFISTVRFCQKNHNCTPKESQVLDRKGKGVPPETEFLRYDTPKDAYKRYRKPLATCCSVGAPRAERSPRSSSAFLRWR